MLEARALKFLMSFEKVLPDSHKAIFNDPRFLFSMEFDRQFDQSGTLKVFMPIERSPILPALEFDHEWFHMNTLWFRRANNLQPGRNGFEAMIEYLPDYRDKMIVLRNRPVHELRVIGVDKGHAEVVKQFCKDINEPYIAPKARQYDPLAIASRIQSSPIDISSKMPVQSGLFI